MDKEEWKSFFRWLDQASAEELSRRKARIIVLLRDMNDRDVKADARRMMRLIESDLLAREGIAKRSSAKRSKNA